MNINKTQNFIKLQIVIAVIAISFTISGAIMFYTLLQNRDTLEKDIQVLEDRKAEAEVNLNSLLDRIKQHSRSATTDAIQPRTEASAIPELTDKRGQQIYNFKLWLESPAEIAGSISRVSYQFKHPSFKEKEKTSSDASNGFQVSYQGWGCLYLVTIKVHLKDGNTEEILFNMCNALSWNEKSKQKSP